MADDLQRLRQQLLRERDFNSLRDQLLRESSGSIDSNIIDESQNEEELVPTPSQPVVPQEDLKRLQDQLKSEEPGIMQRLKSGAGTGLETHQRNIRILNSLLAGEIPEIEQVKQPSKLSWKPGDIAEFAGRVGTEMVPTIAATSAGASAGMAAGPYGAAAGAASMGALFAGGQAYAEAYNNARLSGKNDEEAKAFAKKSSSAAALFAGALGPLGRFGAKDALAMYVAKQIGANVTAAEAENIAQNYIARDIDPDRPLTEGWKEAAAAAAATGAIPGVVGRAAEPPHIVSNRNKPTGPSNILGGPTPPPPGAPPSGGGTVPRGTVVEHGTVPRGTTEHPTKTTVPRGTISDIDATIARENAVKNQQAKDLVEELGIDTKTTTVKEWHAAKIQDEISVISKKIEDLQAKVNPTVDKYNKEMLDLKVLQDRNPTPERQAAIQKIADRKDTFLQNVETSVTRDFNKINKLKEQLTEKQPVKQETVPRGTTAAKITEPPASTKVEANIVPRGTQPPKTPPPPTTPPLEGTVVPRGTSNLPVPYQAPKKGIQVARPPRQKEKVVEGEILHPDVERTKAKIFSKGDMGNPVEQGILNKAAKGISDYWSHRPLETATFDWKAPLKQVGAQAAGKSSYTLRESENVPYRTAAATTHMGGIINAALEHGAPVLNKRDSLIELKPKSKGLMPRLRPAFTNVKKAEDFKAYMYGRRVENQGLIEQGREHNITAPEASELVALGDKNPEFKDMFRSIQDYKKSLLDLMEAAGLINKRQRAIWEGVDHTPFYRDRGEKGEFRQPKTSIVGQKANIHELTGGKRQYLVFDENNKPIFRTTSIKQASDEQKRLGGGATIEDVGPVTKDLYENLIQNANYSIASSARNIAARKSIEAGVRTGIARRVASRSVAQRKRDGELIVSAFENGIERFYQVTDVPFYKALTSTQFKSKDDLNKLQKILRSSKKFITGSIMGDVATVVNVGIKDFARTLIIGKDKIGLKGILKLMPKNYLTSILHETGIRLDPRIIDMMAGGGGSGYFRNKADEKVRELSDEAKKADGTFISPAWYNQIVTAPYKKGREVVKRTGSAVENAHRLTIFDAAMQSGRTKAEAIFEASDLMDYAMHGQSGLVREVIESVPFLKTLLQSIHKLGREVSHNYGWNRTTKNLLAIGTMATANTLINLIPDDDEELAENGYEAQPEWKKNNYVMVDLYKYLGMGSSKLGQQRAKDLGLTRWWQIQKPWTEGFLGLTVPERITNAFAKDADSKKELWQLGQATLDQLYLNPLPPIFKEAIEQSTGYDFYSGNTIVPRSRENLERPLQFTEKTSKTAKYLGEKFDLSPARIDHLIKGLGGTLATYVSLIPDALSGDVNAKKDWSEKYFIKKHLGGELAKDNAFVNELYDVAHQIQVTLNTLEEYENTEQEEKIEKIEQEKGHLLDLEEEMTDYKKSIKEIQDDILEIKGDKTLTSKEKQSEINELIKERNSILYEMHQSVKEDKIAAREEKKANKKGK